MYAESPEHPLSDKVDAGVAAGGVVAAVDCGVVLGVEVAAGVALGDDGGEDGIEGMPPPDCAALPVSSDLLESPLRFSAEALNFAT